MVAENQQTSMSQLTRNGITDFRSKNKKFDILDPLDPTFLNHFLENFLGHFQNWRFLKRLAECSIPDCLIAKVDGPG